MAPVAHPHDSRDIAMRWERQGDMTEAHIRLQMEPHSKGVETYNEFPVTEPLLEQVEEDAGAIVTPPARVSEARKGCCRAYGRPRERRDWRPLWEVRRGIQEGHGAPTSLRGWGRRRREWEDGRGADIIGTAKSPQEEPLRTGCLCEAGPFRFQPSETGGRQEETRQKK